jgi:hypothetical protein
VLDRPWAPSQGQGEAGSSPDQSGRLSRAYQTVARDTGTREVQAKRDQLINGSPVELIASSAGVLCARGLLSSEQYRAADRFARIRAAVFGVPLSNGEGSREATEERIARNERVYSAMCRCMTALQLVAVVDLALGGRPVWARRLIARLPLRLMDQVEREHLPGGLDALAAEGRSEPPRGVQDGRSRKGASSASRTGSGRRVD